MDDMETVARALCQYDAGIQAMPADEMWALYSSEYMKDAESSMTVLAPLFASKRESGYLAGYLDGLAQGKKDSHRDTDQIIADLEDAIVFKDAAIANLGVLIDELRASQPVDGQQHTPEIGQ